MFTLLFIVAAVLYALGIIGSMALWKSAGFSFEQSSGGPLWVAYASAALWPLTHILGGAAALYFDVKGWYNGYR